MSKARWIWNPAWNVQLWSWASSREYDKVGAKLVVRLNINQFSDQRRVDAAGII
jgi:hypothetical protein